MYNFVDTHAHLYEAAFSQDLNETLNRALNEGVQKILIQNVDSTTIDGVLRLEKEFPQTCFATMGLHPCSVKENYLDELKLVEDWWQQRNFWAVGEIGLDYYWDLTFKNQQLEAFRHQIRLAKSVKRPIIIHCRESFEDSLRIVKEEQDGNLKGIFHCFGGTVAEARQAIEVGFLLGIGGVLTYKKSGLAEVIKEIDLQHLVLETDAPYLSPVPYRGKRNESSYIRYIATQLAEIKQCALDEVASKTSLNAANLLGW